MTKCKDSEGKVEASATPAETLAGEIKTPTGTSTVRAAWARPDLSIIEAATTWLSKRIPPLPSSRSMWLAAAMGTAAGIGAVIGAVGTMSFARPTEVTKGTTQSAQAMDQTQKLRAAIAQVTSEIAALKTTVETSNRTSTAQITKISDRMDRSERALAEPAVKLAALTEAVSRLEHRMTATPTPDVTGSVTAKETPKSGIVEGWVIRDIYRGRALVENRSAPYDGGLYEVVPGSNLPGIGRIETITQQNGRWVVVTPKGLIVSMK